jgi:repressor LexA
MALGFRSLGSGQSVKRKLIEVALPLEAINKASAPEKSIRHGNPGPEMQDYTTKQGQYLAFIYYFTKVNAQAPAEADIQRYFGVSPPSVHQMIVTPGRRGFITRIPGQGPLRQAAIDKSAVAGSGLRQ